MQAPDFSQSLNRYSYVWNNPLSFTDPSGFETEGGAPFRFGFGYGAVRVAHHRYPAPHMQPPPHKDAPVGRDTQGGGPEITGPSAADASCLPSGAGATPNWNPADACSDAVAHDDTVEEELRARAGRASGARAVAEISSEAADVADDYARDTVKYGALYYLLRWLGLARSVDKAADDAVDGARTGTALVRVGDRLTSVHDVLANPSLLRGLNPAQVSMQLGRIPAGWRAETLGQGAHRGQGYVLREYLANGEASGRMLRWHPGGGHHGPDPYWTVTQPNVPTVRVPGGN